MDLMGRGVALGLCGLLLILMILSVGCGTQETGVADGGQADGATVVPENTAARCQDSIDNDGDGVTDCQDPDCWALSFCVDAGINDAPAGDGAKPDAPVDLGPIDGVGDVPQAVDGPSADATPISCVAHCDCPQGEFCYYGSCLFDPKMPVYCCAKVGCPPGRWCFETGGAKGTCAESTTHPCQDACDCGPAHCCKKDPSKPTTDPGHCVKDTKDPWDPGGTVVGSLGTCVRGEDATYCCTDPLCHAGKHAYSLSAGDFRCAEGKLGKASPFCSGTTCFGTSCNCDPGESCVDTAAKVPVIGRSCGLFSGGACVSNALAEAIYGLNPAEMLACCSKGCLSGQSCELGWRSDGEWAYARVVGVCGGTCGNGICETGESPASCAEDCGPSCGDGKCFPEEVATCTADCKAGLQCGIPGELNVTWSKATVCGDGVCQGGKGVCDWTEPESCRTCPQDCGACEWELIAGQTGVMSGNIQSVWAISDSDVFAVGGTAAGGLILHYDGTSWKRMDLVADTTDLWSVWGSSASDAFAVGEDCDYSTSPQTCSGVILHYDGNSWTPMTAPTGTGSLGAVWGSSASDVFAVGGTAILHYDGTSWTPMTAPSGTGSLSAVWGSSASDVFAVGGTAILHYDGTAWTTMTSGTTTGLVGIWGSSESDVFAVGWNGTILHYDGTAWTAMSSGNTAPLQGVWGSSGTDVFAVGSGLDIVTGKYNDATILHYDGTGWTAMSSGIRDMLWSVCGSSASDVFAVGLNGAILHYDGSAWKPMTSAGAWLWDVWGSSGSDAFAVGGGQGGGLGTIMHHDGSSWKPMTPGTKNRLWGVWGSSASDVFAVGDGGTILHYDGTSWTTMTSGIMELFDGVWGSSGSDVFAVGLDCDYSTSPPTCSDPILHYDGTNWTPMVSGSTAWLHDVWGSSASDVFAVGFGGTILHYDGTAWTTMTSGTTANLAGVWGSSGSDVFAVGWNGTVMHYDGTSWTAMSSGSSAPLHGVWGSSGTDVFAVGNGVVHYDGTGWSASPLDLRDPISSLCVELLAIGGTTGGEVFITGSGSVLLRRCPAGACPTPPPPP